MNRLLDIDGIDDKGRSGVLIRKGKRKMETNIGFIGFGNMAQAMAQGVLRAGVCGPEALFACAAHWEKLCDTAKKLGITPCRSPEETAHRADMLIVAVKPYQIEAVLTPLKESLNGKAILSVAAGWLFDRYEALLPGTHHLSLMPNTPVSVCSGVVLAEERHSLTPEQYAAAQNLLGALGLFQPIEGRLMDAAGAIAGCGPAFASMFIEALGDAGVRHGLPRQTAYALAAQMVSGTGRLQRETGAHPAAMKDAVCSPGGTTIAGVAALERAGMRAAMIDAVDAVMAHSQGK